MTILSRSGILALNVIVAALWVIDVRSMYPLEFDIHIKLASTDCTDSIAPLQCVGFRLLFAFEEADVESPSLITSMLTRLFLNLRETALDSGLNVTIASQVSDPRFMHDMDLVSVHDTV